jgi:hypothetical protein
VVSIKLADFSAVSSFAMSSVVHGFCSRYGGESND